MSFDQDMMARLIAAHGAVVRVVVAEIAGSTPREAGAAMVVWAGGQEGTIGGGALEYEAAARARAMLRGVRRQARPDGTWAAAQPVLRRGGHVLSEVWDTARLRGIDGTVVARPLPGSSNEMPLAVKRILQRARGEGFRPAARTLQGWMVEPVSAPEREIWIWGAGHVGRALVSVLAPLPGLRLTWIDTDAARFPEVPSGRDAADRGQSRRSGGRSAGSGGASGSDLLPRARSRALPPASAARVRHARPDRLGDEMGAVPVAACRARPLGRDRFRASAARSASRSLGKHPQAIAVGVAADLLTTQRQTERNRECDGMTRDVLLSLEGISKILSRREGQ